MASSYARRELGSFAFRIRRPCTLCRPAADMRRWLALWYSPRIARSAFGIALVVGSALNLINLGPSIWEGGPVDGFRLVLNYLVPYCVASYSAVRNEVMKELDGGNES